MGSLTFGGIIFKIFSLDHLPRHAHGSYAEVVVIVDLYPDGARLASRKDAVLPANAKRSDVAKIVRAANLYAEQLNNLWEVTHGPAADRP